MEDMQNDSVDISFNSSELSCLRLETPKSSQEDLANSHKRKSSSTADSHDYKRKFTSVTLSPIDDDIFDIPQEEESIASSSEDTSPISLHRETSVKLNEWLDTFKVMSSSQQYDALNELISTCSLPHIRFMRAVIEPLLRRDFISLLPKEISLYILSFLSPSDLSNAAQICHYWKKLAEDTKLWKQKCQNLGLKEMFPPSFRRYGGWESSPLPTVVMDLSTESTSIAKLNKAPLPNSCYCRCKYKALYLRHTRVMSNWKNRRFTATCQLRGHDEHCLHKMVKLFAQEQRTELFVFGVLIRVNYFIVYMVTRAQCDAWLCTKIFGHTSLTSGMQLLDNILVSANADSTIKVWDISTGHCIHTLDGHDSAVTSLQFIHGSFICDLVKLPSSGAGGCVWRLKATPTMLVCAVGSRYGTEDTKLILLECDAPYP
uniref:F-box domain-containing protein n=1 Tax=Acrobeloides nanus TaxID=290746 RepID=A0A914BVR0_9BILA